MPACLNIFPCLMRIFERYLSHSESVYFQMPFLTREERAFFGFNQKPQKLVKKPKRKEAIKAL